MKLVLCVGVALRAHHPGRIARDRARPPGAGGGGHAARPEFAAPPVQSGRQSADLQLDDGTILNESLLILSFRDTQHDGRQLLPMDGSDGWRTLADTGRAIAFLDGISVWNRELRFGLKAPGVIAIETARAERVTDGLERALGEGHYQGAPNGSIDAAQIVLGAALENTARRHKVWAWRPLLSAFLDEIARRPSFTATTQPEIER